jgi:hypothetical protein
MYPAIRVIPTFGTFLSVTTPGWGINRRRKNIPASQAVRIIPADGTAGIFTGCSDVEEG